VIQKVEKVVCNNLLTFNSYCGNLILLIYWILYFATKKLKTFMLIIYCVYKCLYPLKIGWQFDDKFYFRVPKSGVVNE